MNTRALLGRENRYYFGVFLLSLFCLLVVAVGALGWSAFDWLPGYLIFVLLLVSSALGWVAFRAPRPAAEIPAQPRYLIFTYAALTFLAFLFRFRGISDTPLWSDEDLQNWFILRQQDIVHWAAYGQQPPLHHYLALLSLKVFGKTLFGLRFFTALFGSLSVPLFFSLLLKTCRYPLLAAAGAIIFLTDTWLVSYSIEAKPYTLAVFFSLLSLRSFYDCLVEKKSLSAWVRLTAVNILFLLTVGMQPLLYLPAAGLIFFVYFLLRGEKRNSGLVAGSIGISLVFFLPILISIVKQTESKGYIHAPAGATAFWTNFSTLFSAFLIRLDSLIGDYHWILPMLVLMGVFSILSPRARAGTGKKAEWKILILALLLLFPALIFCFFQLLSLEFNAYYLILLLPLLIASAIYCYESFVISVTKNAGEVRRLSLLALFFALAFAVYERGEESNKMAEVNIPGLYSYLLGTDVHDAVGFYFTLNRNPGPTVCCAQIGFYGKDYYYSPEMEKKFTLQSSWDLQLRYASQMDQIFDALEMGPHPSHIFFYYFQRDIDADPSFLSFSPANSPEIVRFPGPKFGSWEAATLLMIKNQKGFLATLDGFFSDLDRAVEDESLKLNIYEGLIAVKAYERQCANAESYRRKAEDFCTRTNQHCHNKYRLRAILNKYCAPKAAHPPA